MSESPQVIKSSIITEDIEEKSAAAASEPNTEDFKYSSVSHNIEDAEEEQNSAQKSDPKIATNQQNSKSTTKPQKSTKTKLPNSNSSNRATLKPDDVAPKRAAKASVIKATDVMLGRVSLTSLSGASKGHDLGTETKNNGKDNIEIESQLTSEFDSEMHKEQGLPKNQMEEEPIETDCGALETGRAMIQKKASLSEFERKKQGQSDQNSLNCGDLQVKKKDKHTADKNQDKDEQEVKVDDIASISQISLRKISEMDLTSIINEKQKIMMKNPKFNAYRESVLQRPSHYSSILVAAEGGQEVQINQIDGIEDHLQQEPAKKQIMDYCVPKIEDNPQTENEKQIESEKKSYMVKEQEFYKALKNVQNYYLEICICLMKLGKFFFFLSGVYALFCMFYFGCGVGDCQNTLVCCVHYIKLLQAGQVYSSYSHNVKEKQPTHPIGIINAFITVLLYYICLYINIDVLKEDKNMINFIAIYLVIDIFMIVTSYLAVRKVKIECEKLMNNKKFKEYREEAELALQDVLYLPAEVESDDEEPDA